MTDRTILVYAEQGLGDTLQFIRYLTRIKPLAGRIVFECQKSLRPLLSRFPGIDQLIVRGDPLPEFDVQIPLLSLPRVFQTDLSNIPAEVPYLSADPALVEKWRERLRPIEGFRIGINWQGRQGVGFWRQRDLPLEQFAALAAIPGVRLISLQQGDGRAELEAVKDRVPIVDLGPDVDRNAGAFMDTAAIMMNLDLVITSDTAVPHLAGALGVPVLGGLALRPRLALAAGPRRQPLVSYPAAVPPDAARPMGRRVPARWRRRCRREWPNERPEADPGREQQGASMTTIAEAFALALQQHQAGNCRRPNRSTGRSCRPSRIT